MRLNVQIFVPELPVFAEQAPTRGVYAGDADGRCEIFTLDLTGAPAQVRQRQLTRRPAGTATGTIDPAGAHVWWFDDGANGVGSWRVQPFTGGAATPALPGVPAGRAAGLGMAADGTAAVGLLDDLGLTVHLRQPGEPPRTVLRVDGFAQLVDLSTDGELLVVAGEPAAADAVRLYDRGGAAVAVLSGVDGPMWALGCSPAPGPATLLLVVERGGSYLPATWTAAAGLSELDWAVFDTEIAASWYPDGRRLLVRQDRHARGLLHEVDLTGHTVRRLPTPAGSILAAGVQPDGDLQYVWADGNHPPRLQSAAGYRLPGVVVDLADDRLGRRIDRWVNGPGGPVHVLLTLPEGPGPHPTIFLLHGGPYEAARDCYDPLVTMFVSTGCAVARPNYRGSTGYGAAWRTDFAAGVGLTQLEDLAAVRADLVRAGIADPELTAVCGESWGGYLALLAAGRQPELWHAVSAVNPIADYPAAYRDATAAVKALDVALFGGTPEQVPGRYARSSPATYAAAVRAPVLVIAATGDAKCPPGQIRDYVAALHRHGQQPELVWTDSGHEAYDGHQRAETLAAVVQFVCIALGGVPEEAPVGAAQA